MHSKTFLTTLLAGQVALAAVIPIERDANARINPINGLPAPGSNLNPISGLPTPHKHKHHHSKGGPRGKNPISGLPVPHRAREAEPEAETEADAEARINPINGLPAPGSNLNPISGLPTPHKHHHKHNHAKGSHGGKNPINGLPVPHLVREAEPEPEAEADPIRIVTNMHTSTSTVWIHATPRPHPSHKGKGKRPHRAHRRPLPTNPVNGLPAPGSKPGHGNISKEHGNQHNHPRPTNPVNGLPAPGSNHPNRPHPNNHPNKPHTNKPHGITIRPMTTVTVNGKPTVVPVPKAKGAPQDTPANWNPKPHPTPTATATHVPHLQPSPTAKPADRDGHKDGKKHDGKEKGDGKGQGVIGKKPSRRDVEADEDVPATAEQPEAYGDFAEKADQLTAFDEGIADPITDADTPYFDGDDEGDNDFYTGYSPYAREGEKAAAIFTRGLEGDGVAEGDRDFFETYEVDRLWWEEFGRVREA